MQTRKFYLAIIIITLSVVGLVVSIVNAQNQVPYPERISVLLEKPDNNSTKTDSFNCSFNFKPIVETNTSQTLQFASLVVNGSIVASNQTVLASNATNSIWYQLPSNGTYHWNIKLVNSTNVVSASEDFNLTLAVYVAPEPTPTPTADSTPTPTPAPNPTPTPTPTSASISPTPTITAPPTETPTPIPTPPPSGLDAWSIVIIVIILVVGLSAIAIVLLRNRNKR